MKRKQSGIIYYTIFSIALLSFSAYVLLDTFVIPHSISQVQTETKSFDYNNNNQSNYDMQDDTSDVTDRSEATDMSGAANSSEKEDISDETNSSNAVDVSDGTSKGEKSSETDSTDEVKQSQTFDVDDGTNQILDSTNQSDGVYTENSYQDDNISINITTRVVDNTTVYIADVVLSDADFLKTAFAKDTFGTNVTEKTSSQAEDKGAILAINGDFYGADKKGYVIKNGTIYRDSVRDDAEYDDLVVYKDGSFEIINEKNISAQQLVENGVVQLFAFGPALVENGQVVVNENTEVGKAMASNPRTAIGIVDELHYVFVVADGRSSESEGLSIYELAQLMKSYGCETAYNLDGGGSSTMYFNGEVINKPTTSGRSIKEREVSDIVYIGY